jgi:hypothetical protein
MANPQLGLAKDLFEDMGRKVADASREGVDDEEMKVVDVIESLCMNCHENVRWSNINPLFPILTHSPRAPRDFSLPKSPSSARSS